MIIIWLKDYNCSLRHRLPPAIICMPTTDRGGAPLAVAAPLMSESMRTPWAKDGVGGHPAGPQPGCREPAVGPLDNMADKEATQREIFTSLLDHKTQTSNPNLKHYSAHLKAETQP